MVHVIGIAVLVLVAIIVTTHRADPPESPPETLPVEPTGLDWLMTTVPGSLVFLTILLGFLILSIFTKGELRAWTFIIGMAIFAIVGIAFSFYAAGFI
jgi:hypothetical protein